MPQFVFEDPNGRQVLIEGDEPPSESELDELFGSLDAPAKPVQTPSQFTDISESFGGPAAPAARTATIPEYGAEIRGPNTLQPQFQDLIDQSRAELPDLAKSTTRGDRLQARFKPPGVVGEDVSEGYHAPIKSVAGLLPRVSPEQTQEMLVNLSEGFGGRRLPRSLVTPPPGVTSKVVSGAMTGGAEMTEGIADYLQSAAGITEMSLAKTPAAPVVFIKWAKDMVDGGMVSSAEALEAYKRKDWGEFARNMVHVLGMAGGGVMAAKHGVTSARTKWGPTAERGAQALDKLMPGGELRVDQRAKAAEWLLEHESLKEQIDTLASDPATARSPKARARLAQLRKTQSEIGLSEAHQKLLDEHIGDLEYPVEVIWGSKKRRKGQYMGINRRNKTIEVYGEEFPSYVESLARRKHSKATRASLFEEQKHLNTTPEQARTYWRGLSRLEQMVHEKIYGQKAGENGFTETDLGYEALRQRIDRAVGETPREFIEATFEEKVDMAALEMMGNLVQGLRERFSTGDKTSKGVAAMEKVMANIEAAKAARAQYDAALEAELGPGAMTKRQKAIEEQTPALFPIQQDKMPVRRAPEQFDKSLEAGLGTDKATQARLEAARKNQEERDAAQKFKTNRVGEEDVRFEDLEAGPAAMTKKARDAAKLAAMRLLAKEGKEMPGMISEKPQVVPRLAPVAPEERVGAEYGKTLPRTTSEEFLSHPITAKKFAPRHDAPVKTDSKEFKRLREENPTSSIEDLKQLAITQRNRDASMDRPTFREFEKLHYDKSQTLVAELWKQAIRKEIDSASGERLQQWRKALGLERNFGRTPIVVPGKEITGPTAITGGQIDLPAEGMKSAGRDVRAADLRRQAEIMRGMAEKAKPRADLPKQQADPIPHSQVKLPLMFKEKLEPDPIPDPTTKFEPIKHSEKLEARKLVSKEDFEAKARALDAQADIVESGGSTVFDKGQKGRGQLEQRNYVDRLKSAIKEKLEEESKEFRADISREEISIGDLDFDSVKDKIGNWIDIDKVAASNDSLLNGYLRNQARGSNLDPESSSKRVVAVVNTRTGEVHLLSTYNNAGVQMVADPTAPRNVGKQHVELNNSFKNKYRPFAALLLKDPVKGLRQRFKSVSEFMDQMGTEAKERTLYSREGMEMDRPTSMEIEGTPGLRTEGGMFTGPDKDIVSDAGLGAVKRSKTTPLTDNEAVSMLDQIFKKSDRIKSRDEIASSIEDLRNEKNPVVLSAYRKMAQALAREFPNLDEFDLMDRLVDRIYTTHLLSDTMDQFAASLQKLTGAEPVRPETVVEKGGRELTAPTGRKIETAGGPKPKGITEQAARIAREDAKKALDERIQKLTREIQESPQEPHPGVAADMRMSKLREEAIAEARAEMEAKGGPAAISKRQLVDETKKILAKKWLEKERLDREEDQLNARLMDRENPIKDVNEHLEKHADNRDKWEEVNKDIAYYEEWLDHFGAVGVEMGMAERPSEAGPAAMSKKKIVEEKRDLLIKERDELARVQSKIDNLEAVILGDAGNKFDRLSETATGPTPRVKQYSDLQSRKRELFRTISEKEEWMELFGAEEGPDIGMSGPAAMRKKRNAMKVAEDVIRGTGSFYDEPMVERIKRVGGDKARENMKVIEEMQSQTKGYYGGLTPTLDPARRAAGAQAQTRIPGTRMAIDLPKKKLIKATAWLNDKVLVLPFAAMRRNKAAIEGEINVPDFAKPVVEAAQKANLATGKLYEPVVQASQSGTRFKQAKEHIDKVRKSQNRREFMSLTKTMAEEFGADPAEIRNIFNEWRREERKPGPSTGEILTVSEKYTNKLADLTSKPWVATGRYQNNLTGYGYDVIRQGPVDLKKGQPNEAWHKWTIGLAKANKLPVADVRKMFTEWQEKLDKADQIGGQMEAMDHVNQDFSRRLHKTITDIKVGGAMVKGKKIAAQWQQVVHGDLYNYLESTAQRASHIRAFRDVFPATPEGKAKFEQFMAETKADIPKRYHGDLEALMRTMQGHPTDSYANMGALAPTAPAGTAFRYLNQTAGNVLARMVLTGQMFTQAGEVIAGSTPVFLGYHNYMAALARYRQLYAHMEQMGMVNKVMYDFSPDPTAPVRSGSRMLANTISKATAQNLLNEFQEGLAAATSFVVSEKIRKGDLTDWDKRMLPQTFKAMGFDAGQVKEMMGGNEMLLNQFQRKAASWLTSGNRAVSENSKLGANRLFNSVFRFHSYPMMKSQQFRKVTGNAVEAINGGDKSAIHPAMEQFARFLYGNALQGALTVGFTTLAYQWVPGVDVKFNEAWDDPAGFLFDTFMASVGGPAYLLSKGTQGKGIAGLGEGLARMAFPVGIASELNDAAFGFGKYNNLSDFDRIGKFLTGKIPVSKAISTGMAVTGLAMDNQALDAAMSGFYRWKQDEFGSKDIKDYTENENRQFKEYMKEAKEALIVGDKEGYRDLILKASEAMADKTPDQRKEARKRQLTSFKILKNAHGGKLTPDEKDRLEKRIGLNALNQLEYFDVMMEKAAEGGTPSPLEP